MTQRPDWMAPAYAETWEARQGREMCRICGYDVALPFNASRTFREHCCPGCGGSKRTRDLTQVLLNWIQAPASAFLDAVLPDMNGLKIYETQAAGVLHARLRTLPGYVCSEYFDDIAAGARNPDGVRCENLEALSFASAAFDLVISQDVLEHVLHPDTAFQEIYRVLKPGGIHLFTVPCHEGQPTVSRIVTGLEGTVHQLPTVWHGDPLRVQGSLVVTDFGSDLADRLTRQGMETTEAYRENFYVTAAIPVILGDAAHAQYERHRKAGSMLDYFKYNSVVYCTRKQEGQLMDKPEWTGERFLPWIEGATLHYEHLHRYRFAAEWVAGCRVLDLGCGEGYGSHLLSRTALHVTGLDIDAACTRHAAAKYQQPNLTFVTGSMTEIPVDGSGLFDRVVCFEALEHISAHDELMTEVRRVLAPGGLFVVSTPDKKYYADADGFDNDYHEKELYFNEFEALLKAHFPHVLFFTQYLVTGSRIRRFDPGAWEERVYAISKGGERFAFSDETSAKAPYLVAVASDKPFNGDINRFHSTLVDVDATLFEDLDAAVKWLSEDRKQQMRARETLEEKHQAVQAELESAIADRNTAAAAAAEQSAQLSRVLNSRAWRWAERLRTVCYGWKKLPLFRSGKTE